MTWFVKFKTFILILYSLVAGWGVTCFLFYYLTYNDIMSQELANYLACESNGQEDCPASLTEHLEVFQKVMTASVVLLMLLPLVILTLNIELNSISSCCRRSCRKQEDAENSENSDLS